MPIANKYRPHYTYDDYCQWEGRWELIEGMPYAMAPMPVPLHQRVALMLSIGFETALKKCKQCKVYLPIDWKVADETVVQPDLLIVCKKIEKKFLDFPPQLVVEILSPSTASKDRGEKMEIYRSQKVKYYLIVDPQFKTIEQFRLKNDEYETVSVEGDFEFELTDLCKINMPLNGIWE